MRSRIGLGLGLLTILALAACSDDDGGLAADPATYPDGPDDIVIEMGYSGGFVPVDYLWRGFPFFVVFGDGTVVTPADDFAADAPFTRYEAHTLTPAGVQELLADAEAAGLLGELDLDMPEGSQVTDHATLTVTINANGATFSNSAYALGFDGSETPARDRLEEFVDAVDDLPALVGADNVGDTRPWSPEAYEIRAAVDDPDATGDEVEVVDWPVADVDLATADCRLVPVEDLGSVPTETSEMTRFRQGDVVYTVWFGPWLPDHSRC